MDLVQAREEMNQYKAQYKSACDSVRTETVELINTEDQLSIVEQANTIFQDAAKATQIHAHKRISGIVTRCLAAVFDYPYEFVIHFEKSRGRTEARFMFKRNGLEITPRAVGGGVIDVAAFALRLSCLMFSIPKPRMLLVLDEPFRMVSRNYAPRIRLMLEMLSREMGVQMIMVTHSEDLRVGTVIEIN